MLIFGAETWVVTPRMDRFMGRFHDQVAQWLTRRLPRRRQDGKWECTLATTAREEAGFEAVGDKFG